MIAEQTDINKGFHNDECDLLKRIAGDDRKAFTLLYSLHLHDLYRYVYLFTKSNERSEEIVQAVFVKIWEHRDALVNVMNFKSYVYRSARNLLLDEVRRSQVKQKVLCALLPSNETSSEHSDSKIICEQYYQIAQDAISLLPKKRKLIVELRTRDELSLDEIAERLSISKSVVKKQLYAGMAFVREYFQKNAELTSVLLFFLSFSQSFLS
jgi:RNA polymerase sigma-70 factor (ECF subfamily)